MNNVEDKVHQVRIMYTEEDNTHQARIIYTVGGGLRHTFSGPSVLYSSLVIQNRIKKNF